MVFLFERYLLSVPILVTCAFAFATYLYLKRYGPRFSLRLMLLVITVLAIALALWRFGP